MKNLTILRFVLPALCLLFLSTAVQGQTFQQGNLSPSATPRMQITDWLVQNRVRAKNVANTANIQNWAQGPTLRITGNAVVDQQNYQADKANWIQQNQAAYTQARQQQIQFMQGNQQHNARIDRAGEKSRVTSGNGFILPVQGNTPTSTH